MAQQYLTDSNAASDYLGKKFPPTGMQFMDTVVDAIPNVSVITKIELLSFVASPPIIQLLTDFINDSNLLELTSEVVERTTRLRRKHKLKVPDAIIAATALIYDFTLITHNTSDFKNIRGLRLIEPS